MEKLSCDIIQDLIPSYLDNICSDASRQCVEEHIETCEKCRKALEMYKSNAFTSEGLEEREVDGLKKIKNRLKLQSILSCTLLITLAALGIYYFESNSHLSVHLKYLCYVLLPLCILGIWLLTSGISAYQKPGTPEKALTSISALDCVLSIFSMYYFTAGIMAGSIPFGLEPVQAGPFLHNIFFSLFIIHIALFAFMLVRIFRKNIDCRPALCINLTGIFLIFYYISSLATFADSISALMSDITLTTIIICAAGAAATLAAMFISRASEPK